MTRAPHGAMREPTLRRRLRRRLRVKRIRILLHSPETQALVEQYDQRLAREHRWVHRLEDTVEGLRVALQDVQGIALNGIANADTAQGRLDAIDARVSTALAAKSTSRSGSDA